MLLVFSVVSKIKIILKKLKKVKNTKNETITDQAEILSEIRNFYSKLFENKDDELTDINVKDFCEDLNIPKLTALDSTKLDEKLTLEEIGNALKDMKNNKTPGIDGFPAEFFKFFWKDLKFFVLRAFNHFFQTGKLSISLRHCIISCLPKGDKPREYLKNWRPISLLSVVYKILSKTLANRIKNPLQYLISDSQTGFIKGRFIGDSTRLVYDIMQYVDQQNKDGMLMLIDFEKAFDSVSWKFLYQVLQSFGFGENFIKWINILNNDIKASIIQCGILSESFPISRGARQGDPISAYVFILCAEILSIMILKKYKN